MSKAMYFKNKHGDHPLDHLSYSYRHLFVQYMVDPILKNDAARVIKFQQSFAPKRGSEPMAKT